MVKIMNYPPSAIIHDAQNEATTTDAATGNNLDCYSQDTGNIAVGAEYQVCTFNLTLAQASVIEASCVGIHYASVMTAGFLLRLYIDATVVANVDLSTVTSRWIVQALKGYKAIATAGAKVIKMTIYNGTAGVKQLYIAGRIFAGVTKIV